MKLSNTALDKRKLEKVAKILKTIAHPVKLQVIQILGENESLDVSSICKAVGDTCQISMMSHHLAKMKDNGILESEKDGKQVYYKLADRHILSLFNCIEGCEFL